MDLKSMTIFMFLLLAATAKATVLDVCGQYGGKPNSDITDALAEAWKDACASPAPTRIVIPSGTYYLRGGTFKGPCQAPIEVQLQGTLKAPADGNQLVNSDSWIAFQYIDRLYLAGGGTFAGAQEEGNYRAIGVRFDFVTNSAIEDITSLDSTLFHFNVFECHGVTFRRVTITAARDSANTDGIHIARSSRINVRKTNIGTGDDCISIGDGTSELIVSDVTCGPGHGISVGSLGKYPEEKPVYDLVIKRCTFTNTTNGVRIKTWADSSSSGLASHIAFKDLIMNNVRNPIIIDQKYCPGKRCNENAESNVKISTVNFRNITGTSASPVAVNLVCSRSLPCENVALIDVDLAYSGGHDDVTISSVCENVLNPRLINMGEALSC